MNQFRNTNVRNRNVARPNPYLVRLETANKYAAKILAEYGNDPDAYGDRVLAIVNGDRRMEHLTLKALANSQPRKQQKRKAKKEKRRPAYYGIAA